MENGSNNNSFFNKRNVCLLWLLSLLIAIGISYFLFKHKKHPIVGYYSQIRNNGATPIGDFFVKPDYSFLTIYEDTYDGNLRQIAISSNLLFYRGNDGDIYIGKYEAIWKFIQVYQNTGNLNSVKMDGNLVKRTGFDELRKTNLKVLGIDDPKNKFKDVFDTIEKEYPTATLDLELLDEKHLRRIATYKENPDRVRTFDFIKEDKW